MKRLKKSRGRGGQKKGAISEPTFNKGVHAAPVFLDLSPTLPAFAQAALAVRADCCASRIKT